MFWSNALTAASVASASNVTVKAVPLVPPAARPISVPPKVTLVPLNPIWPPPVPWLRIDSTSSVETPLAVIETVRTPVSKSAESTSVTAALPLWSMTVAGSSSV